MVMGTTEGDHVNSAAYIQDAKRTESEDFSGIAERLASRANQRLLHGAMGLCTESGEFLDQLKKHIYYGRDLDATNLEEEVGDMFWYMAIICDQLGVSFEDLMTQNIAKLKARYGEKFTEDRAINRDLQLERQVLEQ